MSIIDMLHLPSMAVVCHVTVMIMTVCGCIAATGESPSSCAGPDHDKTTPIPCCFHSKGKGDMYFVDEDMTMHRLTYYKDYDNRRIIEVMSEDSPMPLLFLYRNFTTYKKYAMFQDGTCMVLPMANENLHCIPLDAKLKHSIRLEDGKNSGKFRQLQSWEFESNGEFDGRVVDVTGGRCHPYQFRKRDNFVTYLFENVVDGLEEDDYLFFDVDLSACVE